MPRFYTSTALSIDQEITLEDNVVSHIHVLRLKANQPIVLFNGDGYNYDAVLTMLNRNIAKVCIKNKKFSGETNALKLNLAMCLIANDRMDFVIQKATELGVSQIMPVISKFSQRINPERLKKRLLHWQNIIISACEQCGRSTLPKIHSPINFIDLVNNKYETTVKESDLAGNDEITYTKIICNPYNDDSATIKLSNVANRLLILVGPEGGFSEEESALAHNFGFISLQLGTNILRAETAAIVSISSLRTMLHQW